MNRRLMRKHLALTFAAVLFAAVWGYFSDLRHGQTGWFVGRLVFIGSIAFLSSYLGSRSTSRAVRKETR